MSLVAGLCRLLTEGHPVDAARVLESMTAGQAWRAFESVSERAAAEVLAVMEPAFASRCLQECSAGLARDLVTALPVDRAALILRRLEPASRDTLLSGLPGELARRLGRRLRSPEGTAGSLMDPAVVSFAEDVEAGDALRRLRRHPTRVHYYVYLTDRQHRLTGVTTLHELIAAPPSGPLAAHARRPVERLVETDGLATVLGHVGWRSHHALPVVDTAGSLVGVLRYEALRRLESEASIRHPAGLIDFGAALAEVWIAMTTTLLDGFAAPVTRRLRDLDTETREEHDAS